MKLKSPYTMIGFVIIIFYIIISVFPNLITPYSYEDAIGVFAGAWSPPSPEHFLGQTFFGRDVLARIVYAIPTSLLFVMTVIAIGLIGGLIIGIPFNLLKNRHNVTLDGLFLPFFIIPILLVAFFGSVILGVVFGIGLQAWFFLVVEGITMIPIFAMVITKAKFNIAEIGKQLIAYTPLIIGFVLIIDFNLGFMGFSDYRLINLGRDAGIARSYLPIAPWAVFYPAIALTLLILGFFLLYAGFRQSPREIQDIEQIN